MDTDELYFARVRFGLFVSGMTFGKAQGIPETRKCRKSNINPFTV